MDRLARKVDFRLSGDKLLPWEATVGGERWQVRINRWPDEEQAYSLLVDGVATEGFSSWPATWTRPPDHLPNTLSGDAGESAPSSSGVWWKSVRELHNAIEAKNAADLADAERRAVKSGMEPFSLGRLEELLQVAPGSRAGREEYLRGEYYMSCPLFHPEVRTLADFAKIVRALEFWD
jgi:hypothetical protein